MSNWPQIPLGDLCSIQSGGTPSRGNPQFYDGQIPWAKISDLDSPSGNVEATEESISESGLQSIGNRLFQAGTLLLAMYGSVGKCAFAGMEMATNQAILGITANDSRLNLRFLKRWFESNQKRFELDARGVTQKNLSATYVRELEVPLPPLSEQRRITAILDTADGVRQKRHQTILLSEDLLRSVFLDTSGDLASNPKGWKTARFDELFVESPQNGLYRPSSDYGSGTPIVRIDSFYDGYLTELASLKRVRIESDSVMKYALSSQDILINRVNSPHLLGKSALVPALTEPTVFESNMMRLRIDADLANPRFIVTQLQSRWLRDQIRRHRRDAVNQSSINQGDVSSFELRLPPVELQRDFERFVVSQESLLDRLRESLRSSQNLFDSLSQRAFDGEL